ncbi:hypothetical protein ACWGF2_03740 [Streptomyces sp. NPDC054919]
MREATWFVMAGSSSCIVAAGTVALISRHGVLWVSVGGGQRSVPLIIAPRISGWRIVSGSVKGAERSDLQRVAIT